jgi:hypothetical protein
MGHLAQGNYFKILIHKISMEMIKLNGLKFTADDLRNLADVMDNPNLLPKEFENIGEYIERIGLK